MADIILKDTLKFVYNKNANHVLIKFIKLADIHPYLEKIYDVLASNFDLMSIDANGLPVVKTCISKFYTPELKYKMIEPITYHVMNLSQNAYGNYAL